ncbi:acid stress response protein YqgB [Klebsiella pneumoniae]|nr:acid stress response protein YqgB [Klebsiella pneumoniae]
MGRNDLLIRTFLRTVHGLLSHLWTAIVVNCLTLIIKN